MKFTLFPATMAQNDLATIRPRASASHPVCWSFRPKIESGSTISEAGSYRNASRIRPSPPFRRLPLQDAPDDSDDDE